MMGRPQNGIYIVMGEINLVVTAMKRSSRWSSHTHHDDESDPLVNSFIQLKDVLNTIAGLEEMTPNEFLGPFLEVIRSEDTTGPITGLALTSINKFLNYGLIDDKCDTAAAAIENIADAVTHARFVGTDPSSDEVVLMKILHVLRTLILTPSGSMLTNESVCEIMQSCFRICFEMRLSELLRKSAENILMDMVQLLFSRLPLFKEDPKWAHSIKRLKMKASGMETSRKVKKKSPKTKYKKVAQPQQPQHSSQQPVTTDSASAVSAKQSEIERMPPTDGVPTGTADHQTEPLLSESPSDPNLVQEMAKAEDDILNASETIATTPVAGNRTVVDMQNDFQDASEAEQQQEAHCEEISVEPTEQTVDSQLKTKSHQNKTHQRTISLSDASSFLGANEEGTVVKISLQVERTEGYVDGSENMAEELNTSETSCDKCEGGENLDKSNYQSEPESEHVHSEYVNPRGVRFTVQHSHQGGPLIPYGLPCVRELFRFLVSLTNPLDRHNTDVMIHMGLSLLTVALESGADHIPGYTSLMCLVTDHMCKNLIFLLQSERLTLFAAAIRVCFLLFESMRSYVKFQLETYITKLMDIVVSESGRISDEKREMSLESIVQILRIPGLVTELYLNYDCDLYSSNLFEELMKLLSKNAFPVSGLVDSVHLLSLDALLAVIDSIEGHCHHRILHTASQAAAQAAIKRQEDERHSSSREKSPAARVTPDKAAKPRVVRAGGAGPRIRPNRMKIADELPSDEQLAATKHKKRLYHTGTEQFNVKPSKGIAFLQEHGLLKSPLDPHEVAKLLRENPRLDKKQIGEFLSARKNAKVLDAFFKSLTFEDKRVDETLRMFLETFRLPGEAPVISYILEGFAEHYQKCNGEPFANADSCFTLAYAIIMLNVDQHNTNAKKQNIPMTVQEFKKNVKGCDGGGDFDQDMLEEVYSAVKQDEIVMPAEQTGVVKENYLWKVLLKRGNSKEGHFLHVATGSFDRDLFSLVWGPTVAALSFVFDKSAEEVIVQKATSGFRKCAMVSAHYGMSDVFDNLVISLCKFTTLLTTPETPDQIPIVFGTNPKAKLAAKTLFGLAHRHGDILREGWKNILDCMVQLYRARLLPDVLIRVEDFIDPTGSVSLVREETPNLPRSDSGVFSSFYSYFTLSETTPQRGPTPEEQEAIKHAQGCIEECHVDQLVQESKFLRMDSLQELLKALIFASRKPEEEEASNGSVCDEDAAVFFFELLVKVVLQNRDRVAPFWQSIRDHIYDLVVNANEHRKLVERAVVGLLRIAIRLLRREEIAPQVLASLRMLLMMKPAVIHAVSHQVSHGLHDLLKTNAANIHSTQDWYTLFTLLEVTGAGSLPPPIMQAATGVNVPESLTDAGAQSDSEIALSQSSSADIESRGYTSDSELYENKGKASNQASASGETMRGAESWQMVSPVNKEDVLPDNKSSNKQAEPQVNQYNIALVGQLVHHNNKALMKSCETLAFLVRDAAHVTPHNFESCVHCLRTFVEASINGGLQARQQKQQQIQQQQIHQPPHKKKGKRSGRKKSPKHLMHLTDSEDEKELDSFHSLSIQLLDLMHTLHTRAATIFSSWAEEEKQRLAEQAQNREPYLEGVIEPSIDAQSSSLWLKCWCPLLQGIARLCCDIRKLVRGQALTYLQRALLVHDLQTLSPAEWENCFNKVLFPLLHLLLENINSSDPAGIEETRMRASTLLCKVFLQHLTPLLSLSTFTALWLTILDFMDKYMHADKSDLLCEAIPESLKNMLLVMHTAGILSTDTEESQLWKMTWERINIFLPNLREDVFKPHETEPKRNVIDREPTPIQSPLSQATPTSPARNSNHPKAQQTASHSHVVSPTQPISVQQPRAASPLGSNTVQDCSPVRSESPLAHAPLPSSAAPPYILHPPLPSVAASPAPAGHVTVPLILNPELMQGTAIPIIHSQSTPEKASASSPVQQSVVKDY